MDVGVEIGAGRGRSVGLLWERRVAATSCSIGGSSVMQTSTMFSLVDRVVLCKEVVYWRWEYETKEGR
jgi:hypothetical protein